MPSDLALSSTLIGSNYPCLELIFMVPKVFEPLKFDCISTVEPLLSSQPGEWPFWLLKGGGCSAEGLYHRQFGEMIWRTDLALALLP